jgi:hypothetical protein
MALRKSSTLGIILPYLRVLEDLIVKMIILGDEIGGIVATYLQLSGHDIYLSSQRFLLVPRHLSVSPHLFPLLSPS